ncbi:MAG: site-specific integrase [Pseudohongiellaceae bacterium]
MATIRKVGKRWRVEVRRKGQPSQSRYFDSKMRARAWAQSVEARIGGGQSLLDALDKYASEVSPGKKGERWEVVRLTRMGRDEIAQKAIALIDGPDIALWRDRRLTEVAGASVRREMNLLSSVFQKAIREWGWCDTNPVREVDRPAGGKERTRRITDDEIERIQLALGFEGTVHTKQHEVAVLFLLAIETAMRLGEMVSLDPEQIHLNKRYVELLETKNGSERQVPLSKEAVRLLSLVPEGFTVASGTASTFFRRACINAEITGLRFHDTRREGTSRMSQKMDVMQLARVTGHRDLRVLLNTYYRPDVQELVDLLD